MQAVADIQRMHTCQIGDTEMERKQVCCKIKPVTSRFFCIPLCMLMCFAFILYICGCDCILLMLLLILFIADLPEAHIAIYIYMFLVTGSYIKTASYLHPDLQQFAIELRNTSLLFYSCNSNKMGPMACTDACDRAIKSIGLIFSDDSSPIFHS